MTRARSLGLWSLFLLSACQSATPVAPPVTCSGPDQVSCGQTCAILKTDDANCGSCANACPADQACAASSCHPRNCGSETCDPSSVCFQELCVEKSCVGVVCPSGQVCSQGACTCAADRLSCSGQCVDPQLDDLNCGGCGRACPSGQACANGTCFERNCAGEVCDPSSVCYQNVCTERPCVGVACPSGEKCAGGVCGCFGANSTCDGGACVDTRVDSANCGACNSPCAPGEQCAASTCFPHDCPNQTCGPLEVCDQGACVDAKCVGVNCGAGKTCSFGSCICAPGLTACAGTCVDLTTNPSSCGACGRACATGEACGGGNCGVNPCPIGQTSCGGSCVDLSSSAAHCTACGAACGGGRNCVNSQCVCPAGLALCGTQCTNLGTDPANCGSCSNPCNGGTCGTPTAGRCSCPSGRALCNGTCVDLTNDELNCGNCNLGCSDGGTCTNSVCTCPAGQRACGGRCIDVSGDNVNCGNCGVVCASGRYCANGACQAPLTCQSNYNAAAVAGCPYFPLLSTNCGAETVVTTQLTGTLASGMNVITPLTLTPSERLTVFGTFLSTTSTTAWEGQVRNSLGQYLSTDNGTNGTTGQPNFSVGYSGSVWSCAHPTDLRLAVTGANAGVYDLTYSKYARERWNTGAPAFDFADAGMFRSDDAGVVCDQLCGDIRRFCGDDRQSMALVIPAGKAVAFQMRLYTIGSGANVHVQIFDGSGAAVCNIVNNVIADSTPNDYQGRVVNNTGVPQRILISPYNWGVGGNFTWQIAAATEP